MVCQLVNRNQQISNEDLNFVPLIFVSFNINIKELFVELIYVNLLQKKCDF
jgi:hypothetical protein